MIKHVAFFGGAAVTPESQLYKEVIDTSKLLAQNGFTIVNGGGPGVMMASTIGAESCGGNTLCVTFSPDDAPGFEGRYIKNRTDSEIKTENYVERMFTLMEQSDCFVITRGGPGTISEFGTAWCMAGLYYGKHKPFILYGEFWKKIMEIFNENMLLDPVDKKVYRFANTPAEVLTAINELNQELKEKTSAKQNL